MDGKQIPSLSVSFVVLICVIIMLGNVQFGFAMASWNAQQTPFLVRYWKEWNCDLNRIPEKAYVCEDAVAWSSGVLTATILGGGISALSGGFYLAAYSKRTLIYAMNLFIVVGTGIASVDHMIAIYVGKTCIGIAIGGFSVTCPKYMMDFVPARLKVHFTQWPAVSLAIGMFIPALLSLLIPDKAVLASNPSSFYVQQYWRIVWMFPVLIACCQVALLFYVVPSLPREESPKAMEEPSPKQEGSLAVDTQREHNEMSDVGDVVFSDSMPEKHHDDLPMSTKSPDLTWKQTFFDRRTCGAAWVGILVSSAQHTSGQIGLVFYSADIFERVGFSAVTGIVIIQLFNFCAAVPSYFMIRYCGRRTALLFSMIALSTTLAAMGVCVIYGASVALTVFMALLLTSAHLGALPLGWVYVLEVSNEKGVAVSMGWNWLLRLLISIFAKALFLDATIGDYSFFIFGALNTVCTILIFFTVKETKYLSEEALGRLYLRVEKRVSDKLSTKEI